MRNPKFLNLYDPEENEVIEYDMDTIDRIIITPAREIMSSVAREAQGVDALDQVVRIQFKGESSKEFPLTKYEMEFIYH